MPKKSNKRKEPVTPAHPTIDISAIQEESEILADKVILFLEEEFGEDYLGILDQSFELSDDQEGYILLKIDEFRDELSDDNEKSSSENDDILKGAYRNGDDIVLEFIQNTENHAQGELIAVDEETSLSILSGNNGIKVARLWKPKTS